MYTKRVQLTNYGPIDNLDIEFPFERGSPKSVVLVGENGSGKSIFLSHIVNGLIAAKNVVYPDTPEVKLDRVYKIRSSSYIKTGAEFYISNVDYSDGLFLSELRTIQYKGQYPNVPKTISRAADIELWERMAVEEKEHYESNLHSHSGAANVIKETFAKNCVLYFPFNRFEEPAWLNEGHLTAEPRYTSPPYQVGATGRKIIASTPLRDNHNWLFDVVYDRSVFEIVGIQAVAPLSDSIGTAYVPVYSGPATTIFETARQMLRAVLRRQDVRFGIGRRHSRVVSIMSGPDEVVQGIFHLSSGETALLNLFLSILRDFDLTGTSFAGLEDIHGIVVVDEIDLHLHAIHQYEVLPELIKMFPKVQFVVTTHSPLFVLGMQRVFGEDGFALYRLPQGHQISAEEFSEFGNAYQLFTETVKFSDDMRTAIQEAQKPVLLTEGDTDVKYIEKAAELLGRETLVGGFEVRDCGGSGNLVNIWKGFKPPMSDLMSQKVVLLFDDDEKRSNDERGNLFQRTVPFQPDNPIKTGIENLFNKATLEKACLYESAFIDVEHEHESIKRGVKVIIPETWTINHSEKMNLCKWLCDNGTDEDFKSFQVIFDLMDEVINSTPSDFTSAEFEVT